MDASQPAGWEASALRLNLTSQSPKSKLKEEPHVA
jgi:hypothetical protein